MDFEIPYSPDEIDQACREVIRANNLSDCYVRPIAWRGSEMMGVAAQAAKIHLAVAAWNWGSYFPMEQRLKGIRIAFATYRRPAPDTAPFRAKAAGLYMICTIEKHRAERAGYSDALMLDYQGHVAECTGANVFFIKDGAIHTPVPDCFLDGITRRTVIDIAKARGIAVIERDDPAGGTGHILGSASSPARLPRSRPSPRSARIATSPGRSPRRCWPTTWTS